MGGKTLAGIARKGEGKPSPTRWEGAAAASRAATAAAQGRHHLEARREAVEEGGGRAATARPRPSAWRLLVWAWGIV